jgi:hypothetical protein
MRASGAKFAGVDVQALIASQQSAIAQLQGANDFARRRIEWESRVLREQQWLWDMERRATAAVMETVQEIARRPFDNLISRVEQESRAFQKLTDDLSRSATATAALESMRISETIRRVIDPVPALKAILPNPDFFATVFDSARALQPFVELETQIAILTSKTLAQSVQIGSTIAATIGDTIKAISAVVDAAQRPYVENPLFGAESVASDYADLTELVAYGSENFARPGFGRQMEAILVEIQGLRMDGAKEKVSRIIVLWVAILTLLIQAADYYHRQVSENRECKLLPPAQQQSLPSPSEKPDTNDTGPCP